MQLRAHPDLVFWYSGINPYYLDRFNALASMSDLSFECWFSRFLDGDRQWHVQQEQMHFPHRFVPSFSAHGRTIGLPPSSWWKTPPRMMVSFHGDPAVAASALQSIRPRVKLTYYVEKTFDSWTPRAAWKEFTKRRLFRLADAVLTPGPDADAYASEYGADPSRRFRLNHVIDTEHFSSAIQLRMDNVARNRRRSLGLQGVVFLNIGRMWWQKGIKTLIDAFALVLESGAACTLLLVGDGPDLEEIKRYVSVRNIPAIVFLPFVQQPGLPGMYALGDVFVFPTRGDPYGLVVDEAMAAGLPIIASNAAGEIKERVKPPSNGYLFEVDDTTELSRLMALVASDSGWYRNASEESLRLIRGRTTALWVSQIEVFAEARIGTL